MRLSPDALFGQERPCDITGRSIRGGGIALSAQFIRFAMQTVSTVVLARLLTPDDYGVVAMAAVVIGFAQVFASAGLSAATVQRELITREQVDSLFWVNLAVSGVIAGGVLVSAPLVAAFYRSPPLAAVTAALSASFVLSGITVQHDALLRRHMEFRSLAVIQVGAQLVSIVVTLVLALLDCGYWALVGGSLSSALASSVLTFYYCPFVPRRPRRGTGIRGMLLFGGHLTAFDVVNYFGRTADNILVGRFLGADALGLYSRAYSLFMLPISQIREPVAQVGMPALSALREQPERFRRYYSRVLNVMAVLTVPLGVYCALEAEFLVRVLLGSQWIGLVGTFRILAIVGIVQPTASTVGLVLVSQGHARRQLRIGLASSVAAVGGFVVGLPFGIEGVAAGYAIASYIIVIPNVWLSYRDSPVRLSDFGRAMWPAMGSAAVAAGLAAGASALLAGQPALQGLGMLAVFAVGYCAIALARPSIRETLRLAWRHRQTGVGI